MAHRLVEHVGEIELALESSSEEGLFADATRAFCDLVDGAGARGRSFRREVALAEADPALLLVAWLNELVFLAEVEAFVPERIEILDLADGLRATVLGARGRPRHVVKAATLHDLELEREGEVWRARVVLDV